MSLKVDMRKIIVPWEIADAEGEEDLYGATYTTSEGREDGEPVATKAEADMIVQEIADQKVVAFDARRSASMVEAGTAAKGGGPAFKQR